MASLLSGLLGILSATNQTVAASNFVHDRTGLRVEVTATNDPVEMELQRILVMDDEAQAEADRWLTDNDKLLGTGAEIAQGTLRGRILQRFEPVERAYRQFLDRHPAHAKGRVAYGSFLGDIGREDEAKVEYEKAVAVDPRNTAALNNLANYYGHNGPVTNAFACYEKAIALLPDEPVYYQNLATTVYLFRWDATNYYRIDEQAVYDKAMKLYRRALELDPKNFPLATDLAQTYYGIQPPRVAEAFKAWNEALSIARDDIEREGVHLHLARWHKTAGDLPAARRELGLVTNQMYASMKERVLGTVRKAETNGVGQGRALK